MACCISSIRDAEPITPVRVGWKHVPSVAPLGPGHNEPGGFPPHCGFMPVWLLTLENWFCASIGSA